ncbi:acyltransferase [Kitasatospora sp. NPDC002040]|uniref:acyltransferase family protein n=1 Tax=Kitasatospora sp. NPDC002040 TaxID=3154661 RepID=UPI003320F31C
MADLFTGRDNSLGVLRLLMASAVIVSHAGPIAFGSVSLLNQEFHGQTNIGNLAVYGFFVLSGILVTRSGVRLRPGRFLWHRALRLLPGLWVCLLVTGLVIAPVLYHRLHGGTLAGFWGNAASPLSYLRHNLIAGEYQSDVAGVMESGARAGLIRVPEFNGSLWSLKYEMLCYLAVAALCWAGVLLRARRLVLVLAAWLGCMVLGDALAVRFLDPRAVPRATVEIPHLGWINLSFFIYLALAFTLGAVVELYRHRIRINDVWGVLSGVLVVGSLLYGYFFAVGLPAFAYLLVWLAIRLPKPFRRIGAKRDYSYGLYIYGFPVEQLLAGFGGASYGLNTYRAMAVAGTLLFAVASWHLVERPALKLKDVRIPLPRSRRRPPAEEIRLPEQQQKETARPTVGV